MAEVMENCFGNPSSTHAFGRSAKAYLETARKGIAKILNAQPQEIIFTSGGTESDNMVLHCAVRDLGVKTIISSAIEHHAILHTLEILEQNHGIEVKLLEVSDKGEVDFNQLEEYLALDNSPKLVTLMHINNEIGNLLDLEKVVVLCQAHQAYFHSDAVQGIGHYPFDLEALKIDFLSAAAHKFHGPKGIGFAYIRKNRKLMPLIHGGTQERGLRAGTESVHNIVGMFKALEIANDLWTKEKAQLLELKKYFLQKLKTLFPDAITNGFSGDLERSTYTLVNVALPLPESKAAMLDFHLDLKGIACSKGSACQSGSTTGSHVLNALGTATQWPSLRFSFSIFNTKAEIDFLMQVLEEFLTNKTNTVYGFWNKTAL